MSDVEEESLFPYNPNEPAAIAFVVLFAIVLLGHIYQASRGKTLYMLPLLIGTALQVVGYVLREITIRTNELTPYIISQTFIVVSPAFLAAQAYMIVGRMMSYVGPESTFISHTVITKLFVGIDILSIITQSSGSVFLFADDNASLSTLMTGRGILIGGLVLQVAAFGIFLIIEIIFHRKAKALKGKTLDEKLGKLFWAFYVCGALVMVRSLYRTVEFADIKFDFSEAQGYLFTNEWPYYVLDSLPVLIATAVFNLWHPKDFLPRKKGERMDGSIEQPRRHWWSRLEVEGKPTPNQSDSILLESRV